MIDLIMPLPPTKTTFYGLRRVGKNDVIFAFVAFIERHVS